MPNPRDMPKHQRLHLAKGWVDGKDNITPAGDREAERRHAPEPGPTIDEEYPTRHGWAPDPFPGGGLI